MFAGPRDAILRLHASSGTTGKATVVGHTKGDLDRWADLMARSLACAGARPGDIIHNAYGYGLFTGGRGGPGGAPPPGGGAWICAMGHWRSASWAPSRGARGCAARSRSGSGCARPTFTDSPRSW